MLQKRLFLMNCCGGVIVSSIFLSGCGEQKIKSKGKTDKTVAAVEKSGKKIQKMRTPNFVFNPSFEESKSFSSGLYKKGKSLIEKPAGWITKGQVLNDFSGWVSDEAHSGKRSLKIENMNGADAYWEGKAVIFKEPANAFKASIWSKVKDIRGKSGKEKFQLEFDVYFKKPDGKNTKKRITIRLPKTNKVWKETKENALFKGNIVKVIPYIRFSDGFGSVYVDDISICPISINFDSAKTLFDSNKKNSITDSYIKTNEKDGEKIYEVKVSQAIFSTDFISVEHNKIYKLSGMFKSGANKAEKLYFGYAPYSSKKESISRQSVIHIKNTETELVKECNIGDTVVYIKNAKNWVKNGNIAFDIDDSGNYSDLPNFNLSSKIFKITKAGEFWEIELLKPLEKVYPAGTKIREHYNDGTGTYIYSAALLAEVPDKWTEYNTVNMLGDGELYKHMKYVKILLMCNIAKSKDSKLDFKNIKLQEITK